MDQANKLRELVHNSKIDYDQHDVFKDAKVLAVTSGKGGVGKSNFVANLAINLRKRDYKVLIIDADIGLANIELIYDIIPKKTLKNILLGEDINDVLQEGPFGIKLLSGGSGIVELSDVSSIEYNMLLQAFAYLEETFDYIIIDTGAGINELVLKFLSLADEIIIVTLPEPTAITDAYALLKIAHKEYKDENRGFSIVVNKVDDKSEGEFVVRKLSLVAKKFLNLDLKTLGYISDDYALVKSVKKQDISFLYASKSRYIYDIDNIAKNLLDEDRIFHRIEPRNKSKIISRLKNIIGR